MEIFDCHVHIYPGMLPNEVIEPMDQLGIRWSTLLAVDHGFEGERRGSNVSNQFVAEFVAAYPDRFIGIGSIHPDRGDESVFMLEDMVQKHGLKGIKIYPHSGFYPNDPVLMPVYQRLEALGGVALIHTGIKALRHQHMAFNHPLNVDEIAVSCPELPIVICHVGYPWTEEAILISRLNPNVWLDLTFLETLELVTGEEIIFRVLKQIKTMIGCDRLIWGSEGVKLGLEMYPDAGIDRMKIAIQKIEDAPFLTGQEKENILSLNARRLFKV